MDVPALINAIAALVAAFAAWRANRRVKRELSPNHGSSTRDAINRIEKSQNALTEGLAAQREMIRSLGHQVGEIRRDASQVHEDHADRLRNLEKRL